MRLTDIVVYPLKGARGFHPASWSLDARGLRLDRRWMLVDAEGRSISQRAHPRLTRIRSIIEGDELVLSAPGCQPIGIETQPNRTEERVQVQMEGEEVSAAAVGGEVDRWFTEFLEAECHLVFMPEDGDRRLDRLAAPADPIGFPNAYPLHLVSQASLDDLNARLETPVAMDRFRPNLVVSGTEPHEDDVWKRIEIGETVLRIGRRCDHRCGVPNIDQETGARGVEPLKTLATYRRSEKGILFGQNVAIDRGGELRVGDSVRVVEVE